MTGPKDRRETNALCASCDRCRTRKTKCDGQRPCSNCAAKYIKKHKLSSLDGVDVSAIECVYSPAKRRGPIPGRTSAAKSKSPVPLQTETSIPVAQQQQHHQQLAQGSQFDWQQQQQQPVPMQLAPDQSNLFMDASQLTASALLSEQQTLLSGIHGGTPVGALQSVESLQGQHQQLQQQINGLMSQGQVQQPGNAQQELLKSMLANHQQQQPGVGAPVSAQQQQMAMNTAATTLGTNPNNNSSNENTSNTRQKLDMQSSQANNKTELPRTVAAHSTLLLSTSAEGERLRAYYNLSVNELIQFEPTPSHQEYCQTHGLAVLPSAHVAALSAARFAELALGALGHNEVALAMELCNAVVHCLRESVQSSVLKTYMYPVAKSYFLLGVFRACRGDMDRYFKYRRVCLTYLGKLDSNGNTSTLMAAVAFLDAWAYMTYNAEDKNAPNADTVVPILCSSNSANRMPNATEIKYNVKMDPGSVASDPRNKTWIQGPPPVYLNNEAPLHARALDALACAIRTCCDQANSRFAMIDKEAGVDSGEQNQSPLSTPTYQAVMSHENELCSRNIVLSAYTLVRQAQNTSSASPKSKNDGIHVIISAMDAFLDNSVEDGVLSDGQIQSLLCVCNSVIENPLLLHHAGPTYHMATNATVLLAHLLNGLHANKLQDAANFGKMEQNMYEEVIDCYVCMRKVLTVHRRKLPVVLRCHGLPRQNMEAGMGSPLIDLGETMLCGCRGCQGFVLMACSPCVAAERARTAKHTAAAESARESLAHEIEDVDQEIDVLGAEFEVDDDTLLGMISNLVG